MVTRRQHRVAELIQSEISAIMRRKMKDPRIGFTTITGVEMSPDLKYARVYISSLGSEEDGERALEGLQSAAKFIRGEIGRSLDLKYCPFLSFFIDESFEEGARIEARLMELNLDDTGTAGDVTGRIHSAEEIALRLKQAKSVLIVSHSNPDGDSIGSQLALAEILGPHVPQITMVGFDPVPRIYRWMPGSDRIVEAALFPEHHEVIVALECCNLDRTGITELSGDFVINMDHHELNDHYGDMNWVSPEASSVGEMVYHVALELQDEDTLLPRDAAVNLYTAILTDTGSFRFSNASPEAFRVTSRLVESGAQPAEIASLLYDNHAYSRFKLLGPVLSTLDRDPSGRLVWMVVRRSDLEAAGATDEDLEGIINLPRSIGTVEVAVIFKEMGDGSLRVSMRSNRLVDVAALAASFGGGGHVRASGFSIDGPLEGAMKAVLEAARRALDEAGFEAETERSSG